MKPAFQGRFKLDVDSLSVSTRFVLLVSVMILFISLIAQMFFARQERADLELRLQEKSTFLNSFYSYLIADSLMRKDDVTLLQVINRLEEDQEITSVAVVDQADQVRYHIDPQKVGTPLEDPLVQNVLQSGQATLTMFSNAGGRALALVSPLKVQGADRPIGAVRIDFTYQRIEKQLSAPRNRYWFIILGQLVSCIGLLWTFMGRWITAPLQRLRLSLAAINTAQPEANLRESPNEWGQVNAALNDLILRFKTDWEQLVSNQQLRGEQEKAWVQQLASSFLPEARVIVADKENRILSDSGNGTGTHQGAALPAGRQDHLMDLIKEGNFATLLNHALQNEGAMMQGPVTFQDKEYIASILSVPMQQSSVVKTLIALKPNSPYEETPYELRT